MCRVHLELLDSSLVDGDIALEANKLKHLSPEANRRSDEGCLIDVDDGCIPDQVDLVWLEPLCLLEKLPESEGDRCNEHHCVVGEQTLNGELAGQESGVAVGANDTDQDDEGYDCTIGLEISGVWKSLAIKSLGFAGSVEAQVGDTHGDEVDQSTSSDDVDEPVQDGRRVVRQLQERQEREDHNDDEAIDGHTVLGALAQELGARPSIERE